MAVFRRGEASFTFPKADSELRFQKTKIANPFSYLDKLCSQQITDMRTGVAFFLLQNEQLTNLRKGKSELLDPPDEANPLDVVCMEQPKSALGAHWTIKEFLFFVEPDGVNAQPGLLRDAANLNTISHLLRAYILEFTPESSHCAKFSTQRMKRYFRRAAMAG
jgi:hypothetical protein